jgi:hypothetical protein
MTKIFFLHVPKTAGRSLLSVIQPLYDPADVLYGDWNVITPQISPAYRLVAGHLYLGDFSLMDFKHHYRITILRDPMERAISHYYHINERKARDGKVQDYLQHALDVGLSESIMDGSFTQTLDTHMQHLTSFPRGHGSAQENCGSAKTNLGYFNAVGFMDNYSDFMHTLCAKLGIDLPQVPHVNPPKWKPEVIPLTDEARGKLLEMLEHEYWLYNWAKREFGEFKV